MADLVLRAPASQTLSLAEGESKRVAWEPDDRFAGAVEMRAFVVGGGVPNVGLTPIVSVVLEYGHGDTALTEPLPGSSAGAVYTSYVLPGRGFVLVRPAREARLTVHFLQMVGAVPAVGSIAVLVSFHPVASLKEARPVCATLALSLGAVTPVAAEACEWRWSDPLTGAPFVAAAASVDLLGVFGEVLATVDPATFADWTPIPVFTAAVLPDTFAQVAYR